MKDASQYPVTFPYGAVDGVYYGPSGSVGLYHRGDDRAMPVGTAVLVNGVQIGSSGTRYGGAHLHIGHFVNGRDTNPNGQGFTVNGGVVTDVSEDDRNGKYVRVADADGSSWVYLHLSTQTVTKGQPLEGDEMSAQDVQNLQDQINNNNNALNARVDDVLNKINDSNKRIDDLTKRQTAEDQPGGLEDREFAELDKVNKRLDKLEGR